MHLLPVSPKSLEEWDLVKTTTNPRAGLHLLFATFTAFFAAILNDTIPAALVAALGSASTTAEVTNVDIPSSREQTDGSVFFTGLYLKKMRLAFISRKIRGEQTYNSTSALKCLKRKSSDF